MKVLILGATGATGRLAVKQFINRNIKTRIVARNSNKVPVDIRNNILVDCIEGSISEFSREKYSALLDSCNAVVCCLGHNITFRGIFGKPRMLVTNTIKNICSAVNEGNVNNTKLILMNTTANRNRSIKENYTGADRMVFFLLRHLLPPQRDNENAAAFLSGVVGTGGRRIEWAAVRPDGLTNEDSVTEYEVFESPKCSPVFNPGKTSRINVSHFIAELVTDDKLWETWKFRMPVIYNKHQYPGLDRK